MNRGERKAILGSYVATIVDSIEEQYGIDPAQLLQKSGIYSDQIRKNYRYITRNQYVHFVNALCADVPWQTLVIDRIKQVEITEHGLVGLLAMCGLTISTAIKAMLRFYRLQIKVLEFEFCEEAGQATIRVMPEADLGAAETFTLHMTLLALLKAKHQLIGPLDSSDVLSFKENASQAEYVGRYFQETQLLFNQPHWQLSFPVSHLSLSLKSAHQLTYDILQKQCEQALSSDLEYVSLSKKVSAILRQCQEGFPCMGQLAKMLAMSTRTLSRKLKAEQTNYQVLLDQERITRAKEFLDGSDLSVTEIAIKLHFSDSSHFTKVFKRYVDTTPKEYRQ